jgi:hypothetical protein
VWAQKLFYPGQEQLSIHWAVDHHRSRQLMVAQTGNEGGRLLRLTDSVK